MNRRGFLALGASGLAAINVSRYLFRRAPVAPKVPLPSMETGIVLEDKDLVSVLQKAFNDRVRESAEALEKVAWCSGDGLRE